MYGKAMARSTTAQLRNKDHQVTVSQHETDAPILPMAQIERLQEIFPEGVAWVLQEASAESLTRREQTRRVNLFVFAERMLGILAGLGIGVASLWVAYLLAMAGHDWVAGVVGGATVLGLVSAFVVRAGSQNPPNP